MQTPSVVGTGRPIPPPSSVDDNTKAAILIALLNINALWELSNTAHNHYPPRKSTPSPQAVTDAVMNEKKKSLEQQNPSVANQVLTSSYENTDHHTTLFEPIRHISPFWSKYVHDGWPKNVSNPIKLLIAGGIAGGVSRTVVAPLERLKVLLQTNAIPSGQGFVQSFKFMVQRDGVLGMFRGNGINVLRIVPYSAVQFMTYEIMKTTLKKPNEDLSAFRRLCAGAIAGLCSVFATYPLDFLRTRISIAQSSSSKTTNNITSSIPSSKRIGLVPIAVHIYKTEGGLRGFYRGMGVSLFGVAPYMALNLALYDYIRAATSSYTDYHDSAHSMMGTAIGRLASGAMAGCISQTCTYPMEVVRRRLQIQPVGVGVVTLCVRVWETEGVIGFWRGLVPNVVKVVPAAAVSFMTYETCKGFLGAS
ncbi:hypothetical protein HDU76_004781 [Blyttiomyces sp. JEL0837]|nr:hypothetical protein HDU76_004781 [Blyttiomyces sp. JEL0837]